MEFSSEIDKLAASLVKFRADLPVIKKDAKANYGKYSTLDNLNTTISPVLAKFDLTYGQGITTVDGVPSLATVVLHSTGQWMRSTGPLAIETSGRIVGAQAQGSAITYARRYALAAILGLAPDEDDDGQAASQKRVAPTAKQSFADTAAAAAKEAVDLATVQQRAKLHSLLGDRYDEIVQATVQKTGGQLTQAAALAIVNEIEKRKEAENA